MGKRTDGKIQSTSLGKTRGRGNGLTLPEKEAIYQAFLALGSKIEVSRQLGVSKNTVAHVIREIEATRDPIKLDEAKQKMAAHLTGRYHETTNMILESITAEDVDSGRIPEYKTINGEQVLVGYKYYGPSLTQKAIAAGIMTDKIKVLRDYERAIGADEQSGVLLIPENVDQLISAIKGKISSIQLLNVNFRQENQDLATRIEGLGVEVQAEVTTVPDGADDFDLRNPQ